MHFINFEESPYFPTALRQGTGRKAWASASGSYVWTSDGHRFLDCTSGFGVSLFGHANTYVAKAISKQAINLPHAISSVYPHIFENDVLSKIARHSPISDTSVILTSSGSEAVEVALKVAFLATGRKNVAYLDAAYHGQSLGVLRVNGQKSVRHPLEKIIPDSSICIPYEYSDDMWRVAFKLLSEAISVSKLEDRLGAVIVEPMQNPAGYRILPDDFCKELSCFCKKNNVLLISDEIFTGFGRSGYWCLSEKISLNADLYCFGKAMTGGMPAGVCIGSKDLFSYLSTETGIPLHSPTFLTNPLVCSAIDASISILENEDIPNRSNRVGFLIKNCLASELDNSPIIRNIRGSGCAIAIHFESIVGKISGRELAIFAVQELLSCGIMALNSGFPNGDVLAITPAAIVNDLEIDWIIDAVLSVHSKLLRRYGEVF